MGCIYKNNGFGSDAEVCSLCDDDDLTNGPEGSENGICVCSDDPDPSDSCQSYESDYVCNECGVDLNVAECECEE
jgi:hypothetical protein